MRCRSLYSRPPPRTVDLDRQFSHSGWRRHRRQLSERPLVGAEPARPGVALIGASGERCDECLGNRVHGLECCDDSINNHVIELRDACDHDACHDHTGCYNEPGEQLALQQCRLEHYLIEWQHRNPEPADALETLQADFAALLQSPGVNTNASQSSSGGSGTSATGASATSGTTNSSVTAALQNFLQQLSQALNNGGQTYGHHHGHGHGHHRASGSGWGDNGSNSSASAGSAANSGRWAEHRDRYLHRCNRLGTVLDDRQLASAPKI